MTKKLMIYIYPMFKILLIFLIASFLYYFKYQLPIIGPLLVKKYYDSGAYDKEVQTICNQAREYFSNIEILDNSLIIFDIDDTAVYNLRFRKTTDLIKPKTTAILPVLELYKYLIHKGFKIIFLTSRNCSMLEFSKKELSDSGYSDFVDLICMPDGFDDDHTAVWKSEKRKQLSQKYIIVGSVGDRKRDFFDNYNGHVVKLPNYLY